MMNSESIRELTEAAEKGDSKAQFNLGRLYADEAYDGHDRLESVYWFKKSAERGYASAQYEIGSILIEGFFLKRDHVKGLEWLQRAADHKHIKSILKLAEIYAYGMQFYGIDIDKDFDRADSYFEKLFEILDDVEAQHEIAEFYNYQDGGNADKVKAIKWYLKAAGNGHVDSQYTLGEIYLNGDGIDSDIIDAIYWFKRAAGKDHLDSCIKLAGIFNNGEMIKRDLCQVVRWYIKADTLGDYESRNLLAYIYFENRCKKVQNLECREELEDFVVNCCHENLEESEFKFTVEFLRLPIPFPSKDHAAEFYYNFFGNWDIELDACYELAEMYFSGNVVSQNVKYGVNVLFRATNQGCPKSQFKLAKMIHHGEINVHEYKNSYEYDIDGMEAIEVAADIYEAAAQKGHVEAQYHLALLHYENNDFANFSIDTAINWCEKAVENGHKVAKDSLKNLYIAGGKFIIEQCSESLDDWIADDEDVSGKVARAREAANELFQKASKLNSDV